MNLFGKKEQFVLLVGENGAILCHFVGKKLEHRLFSSTAAVVDRRDFNALLQQHPNAPISIMLDIMDQNYSQQSLPAVNAFSIDKLVKKRLERDFGADDIKGAISLGREESGRRDWNYLFVSVTRTEVVNQWMDYLVSLPNPFHGIFLLPLESNALSAKLTEASKKEKKIAAEWQLVTSHHKTSGIRQTVLRKGKTIFSRLILPGKDSLPELLAGTIEQETSNTIEYMRRLEFKDEDALQVVMIVGGEIKQHLQSMKAHHFEVQAYTPSEMAAVLGVPEISQAEDKFADILFATSLLNHKEVLKLYTPETLKLSYFIRAYQYSFIFMATVVPAFLLYCLFVGYQLFSLHQNINDLEYKKADIESRWKKVQESGEYDINEATRITDVIGIHKKLLKAMHSPLVELKYAYDAIQEEARVRNIDWSFSQGFSSKSAEPRVACKFDMEFFNTGANIDTLFKNFDAFTSNLRNTFKDYELSHTKLPDKITAGETHTSVDVQVTVTNKLDEKSKARRR